MEIPQIPEIKTEKGEEEEQTKINDNEKKDILEEVKLYQTKQIYIITKELESKIPSILSYIQSPNNKNEIINKINIINYLFSLIQNIPFNLDIILAQKSNDEKYKMNLYEILINEYIFIDKNEKEYTQLLKNIITYIFKKLSFNKDIYRYLFSYISNFLNQKNQIEKNENYYFNEYNYYKLLELILFFYQSKEDEDPINYFFFNGDKDTNITIKNKDNNILNIENNLYILFFIKLIDYNYISPLNENDKETINNCNLLEIKFKKRSEVILINLNYIEKDETLENISIEEESKENKSLNFNIPYKSFNIKETNNVVVKLTSNMKIRIYVNGAKITLTSDIIPFDTLSDKTLESIKLFNGFYGICSTIMIYADSKQNELEDIFPKYLKKNQNGFDKQISKYYQNGLFKEELLIPFIKSDLKKNKVEESNIFDGSLNNLSEENLNLLIKFIEHNLITMYIPTRTFLSSNLKINKEETAETFEEIKSIILIDSLFYFKAYLNTNNLYPNLKYSRNGGVHILSNILLDFSFDIGGINHFLPLIEVMTDYNELLTNKNLEKFMSIILFFFSNLKKFIINEHNTKFFYYLSLFLEKIPEKYYDDVSVHIKSIFMTLMSESSLIDSTEIFNIYKQEFFHNVCLNEKILFRFNFKDKTLIYDLIYKFYVQQSAENKNIDINIMNIINILLYHEKERYSLFCCKRHAEYFNKESKVMSPELNEYIKPIMNIIRLLFNHFILDTDYIGTNDPNFKTRNQLIKIFELLTFDISPCLQENILNLFFYFIKNNDEKIFNYLNYNNQINIITLFIYKISLFDIKELAFGYLIHLANLESNKQTNLEQFIEKYTIYYFPQNEENINNKINLKKEVNINGINYFLTENTENQKKLLSYYDKKHLKNTMEKIYEKAEFFYKEKIYEETNFNILISITSVGDTSFIIKFLKLIKEKIKRINPETKIIFGSKRLLQWLLDTCYHAYLIKNSIIKKEKYIPGFSFEESINNDLDKEKIVDEIIAISNEILLEIFIYDIYKIDYLLTWSKYYYEIKEDKNRFLSNRKFIFDYFIVKLINNYLENNKNILSKYKLYLANIIFEYFAFLKIKGFASGGVLKDLESLYIQICSPFIYTLLSEIKEKNKTDEDNLYLLSEKWNEYPRIKKIFENLYFFGIEKDEKFLLSNVNAIYDKYINGINNQFINELKLYFTNFNNFNYFTNNNICNKGMELILLKYHYFTLLLTVIPMNIEFREILNKFSYFILLIVISSSTLTFDNSKNAKQNKNWPPEEEYKNIQDIIKIILFNFFLFLKEKIAEVSDKLKKFEKNNNNSNNSNLNENIYLIKIYLINAFFFFLSLLHTIYKDVKNQEKKRKKSGSLKGWYNKKFKGKSSNEGFKYTGGYKFIEEFVENCIKDTNKNINESQSSNLIDTFTIIEEKNSFFDDIPDFNLNEINKKDYSSSSLNKNLEKLYINNIENNENIKNYFFDYREIYQRQLFPFVEYILERNKLIGSIIPAYDNSIYTSFDYSFLCLKPNYLPELSNNFIKMKERLTFNKDLVDEINRYQIKINFNEHDKIRRYRKIKKNLFSFNGILSTKKYFYEKNKYICKSKLLNHMTEDYTKIFITPIIDIDYYLPKFSKFNTENLFRNKNKNNLIQIKKLADLSLKDSKTDENKTEEETSEISSNLNGLFLIKEAEYKDMNDLNSGKEGTLNHYEFFKKYIDKKHQISSSNHNSLENSCFVKTSYHIRGFFYNNSNEIGFYSYDQIPYSYNKKTKKREIEDPAIDEIQKDYDPDRGACFGSFFPPQIEKNEYLHIKIPYNEIVFIFKRRYYFKVSAIEIYTTHKKSFFFKFEPSKLNNIINHIKHYMSNKIEEIYIENNKFYNRIGFINTISKDNNMNKKIYEKNNMNLKNIYENWKKWEISTIRLLMLINIYANRSYNDLNQYPVFPWIITDYISEKFPKINSENLMRPLDTPMGMLEISEESKLRKEDYLQHWELSRDDEERDDEFDRYGSHYSNCLYVTYYLVRLFPFANIRIELQGTSFDDPNRLFNAIKTSFECTSTQKSDVRELIPELFCLPEILLNDNDFNLGKIKDTSNSSKEKEQFMEIQDVEMPKWCNNNAYSFVKKHRELLESYEVSNNINKWLNLIFGSKQKGEAGNEIKNLFSLQSYEDYEKTFDKMSPEEKQLTCRILEFGVTPNQIFKHDAPQRKKNLDNKIKGELFFKILQNIKENQLNDTEIKDFLKFEEITGNINFNYAKYLFYFQKDKNSENNKKYIYIMNNNNLDIYTRKTEKNVISSDANSGEIQDLTNPIYGGNLANDNFAETTVKSFEKKETIKLNHLKYDLYKRAPIVWLEKGTIIVKGGYWNGNIILQSLIKEKENPNNINNNKINFNEDRNKIYIYTTNEYSPIMKIVIDKNETIAICGNTNGTVYIYKIAQNNKANWSKLKNINNHNSPITSIAIHENLNIGITCSQNGLCMLYTLPYFKLFNSFILGKDENNNKNEEGEILCPDIALISDKPLPCFIFYVELKRTIYFYSINGHFLKKYKLEFSLKEKNIKIYTDYQFVDYLLIFNSYNKSFEIYSMIDFDLICSSNALPEGEFVDYVLSKEKDHILVLSKLDDNKYKLYILRDSESSIPWK